MVTGCIVTVIGLQLFPIAYEWVGGGRHASDFGAPAYLAVAAVVLLSILLVNRYGSPMLRNMAVLVGMLVGAALAYGLGMGSFHSVQESPWLTVPYPFYFGLPTFSLIPIATMVVVMIVQMVESMGLFVAIGDIVDKPVEEKQVINGLRANGLASTIAGMFAAFPFIAFMENVGLVILTGVRSRWVVAVSGLLMCSVALVPAGRRDHRLDADRSPRRCRDRHVRRGRGGGDPDPGQGRLRAQSLQRADRRLHHRRRPGAGAGPGPVQATARVVAAVPAQQRGHRLAWCRCCSTPPSTVSACLMPPPANPPPTASDRSRP